jgi:hypothetical protein
MTTTPPPTPTPTPTPTIRGNQPHKRLILEVARDIVRAWPNVNYAAEPYLQAMLTLTTSQSVCVCGRDSAVSVVLYFLSNARMFCGTEAKALKAELKFICGIR